MGVSIFQGLLLTPLAGNSCVGLGKRLQGPEGLKLMFAPGNVCAGPITGLHRFRVLS